MSNPFEHTPRNQPDGRNTVGSFVENAVDSFRYSLYQSPYNAIAQTVNHIASGPVLQQYEAPRQAAPYTSDWAAQQIGGGLGVVLPFIAVGAAGRWLQGPAVETARHAMARQALLGATYGGLLTPVDERGDFLSQKLGNGLSGALSFGFMESVGLGMSAVGRSRSLMAPLFRSEAANGILSGLAIGSVNADIDSYIRTGRAATDDRRLESAVGFALLNSSILGGRAAMGLRYRATEQARPTESHGSSPTTATARTVSLLTEAPPTRQLVIRPEDLRSPHDVLAADRVADRAVSPPVADPVLAGQNRGLLVQEPLAMRTAPETSPDLLAVRPAPVGVEPPVPVVVDRPLPTRVEPVIPEQAPPGDPFARRVEANFTTAFVIDGNTLPRFAEIGAPGVRLDFGTSNKPFIAVYGNERVPVTVTNPNGTRTTRELTRRTAETLYFEPGATIEINGRRFVVDVRPNTPVREIAPQLSTMYDGLINPHGNLSPFEIPITDPLDPRFNHHRGSAPDARSAPASPVEPLAPFMVRVPVESPPSLTVRGPAEPPPSLPGRVEPLPDHVPGDPLARRVEPQFTTAFVIDGSPVPRFTELGPGVRLDFGSGNKPFISVYSNERVPVTVTSPSGARVTRELTRRTAETVYFEPGSTVEVNGRSFVVDVRANVPVSELPRLSMQGLINEHYNPSPYEIPLSDGSRR